MPAWSPDGKRIAFQAYFSDGWDIWTMNADGTGLQQVTSGPFDDREPHWSPDGTRIAFSALAGGVSDLSVADLTTGTTRRLTNDVYADLQPAWSPDGTAIAFTTDRFTTDLSSLTYGSYRIGLLDPATLAIAPAPFVADINHLDPEWSADGQLFFVGDPEGVPNVYSLDLATASVSQITRVTTAVAAVGRARYRRDRVQRVSRRGVRGPPDRVAFAG
jgi:Tol biopolymer transport system component